MGLGIHCCYKCPDRVADPNCHSTCERYKTEVADNEAAKAQIKQQKDDASPLIPNKSKEWSHRSKVLSSAMHKH